MFYLYRPVLIDEYGEEDVSYKEGNGTVNVGGTSSLRFAENGGTLYWDHRPTWAFASFVRMARQWQTC